MSIRPVLLEQLPNFSDRCRKSLYLNSSLFDGTVYIRLKSLEQENARLKKLLAETMLDKEALEAALRKKY